MPHIRKRFLEGLLRKTLRYSPIVGIFGHRQVGKTTLANLLSKRYISLDSASSLALASQDAASFLEKNKASPLVIDECQLAPELFPALKEHVRQNQSPGQFLLTGSVRFSSRRAIRESLTGRIVAWELLPMDMSETYQSTLPIALIKMLTAKSVDIDLPTANYFTEKNYLRYLQNGGLPGIFSIRDSAIKRQRYETQINTILERDLQLIFPTTLSYRTLRHLLATLASKVGEPLEWSSLSRAVRISIPTLYKLIAAFEAMFLIRLIPTVGSQKKAVLFFEDVGEANYLSSLAKNELTALTLFLFANLRTQFMYRPEASVEIFQYRNRGGGFVPLCFNTSNHYLGILPSLEENPSDSILGSARSFLRKYKQAKILIVHRGDKDKILQDNIRIVSAGQLI